MVDSWKEISTQEGIKNVPVECPEEPSVMLPAASDVAGRIAVWLFSAPTTSRPSSEASLWAGEPTACLRGEVEFFRLLLQERR